jgi:spore coat polysaccharide biosynthesis protein SpsF (cytidylyltransferase family)
MSSHKKEIIAITQARMSSSRLPGKTLREMAGTSMLELMQERLHEGNTRVRHVIATSIDPSDDPIEDLCEALEVPCVRGSLDNVLDRYVRAIDEFNPAVAIRLTGDNPILDSRAVEAGVQAFTNLSTEQIGVCNHLADRTDPLGYCVEVFQPDALRWLNEQDLTDAEREHVTLGFKNRDMYGSFHILPGDHSGFRWTVDTSEDFEYMTHMFEELGRQVSGERALQWSSLHPHPKDRIES